MSRFLDTAGKRSYISPIHVSNNNMPNLKGSSMDDYES